MQRIAKVGSLLKKIYRNYSNDLLDALQQKGFIDLRPSFLEILTNVCEMDAPSIKEIGVACGLKKQTMTSHLNELERRGYIVRKKGESDKREQRVFLTEYGEKFKISMLEVIAELENEYLKNVGEIELDRITLMLETFHSKIKVDKAQQSLF
ncbi:MAG: MarR family transcriptional regulator [Bacteriovoracaceae bacterium]|nr:MarR family transcriptional regulator [Bacteriovoracaceae bacterium]